MSTSFKTEQFVRSNLATELREIESSLRKVRLPMLNVYEKTLIYKYSDDGYITINEQLIKSEGKNIGVFGMLLEEALKKLNNFKGLVYRSVFLEESEIQVYGDALQKSVPVKEFPFLSTTKSGSIAKQFKGNVLFRIISKTGKEIEEISKFGTDSQNEQEVLFCPNCIFNILGVKKEKDLTIITMEEL